GLTVDLEVQDARVEGLDAQRMVERVVVELDGDRTLGPAVKDSRRTAGSPQAAARTRTLQLSRRGNDFHVSTPGLPGPRPAAGVRKPVPRGGHDEDGPLPRAAAAPRLSRREARTPNR